MKASSCTRVKVVLPAYNEAANIPPLMEELLFLRSEGLDLSVLLADDGSTDGTSAAALDFEGRLPLTISRSEKNLGLGETFARGMLAAVEEDCSDVIVCMDADDSHRPSQIPLLLEAIEASADVAIASRYRAGARIRGVPLHRKVLARGLSMMFQLFHPVEGVRDYSTSFRAYRRELLERVLAEDGEAIFDRDGFGCMVALLVRLDAHGAVFAEVPVELGYDRKRGASKMSLVPTVAHNLRVLIGAQRKKGKRRR